MSLEFAYSSAQQMDVWSMNSNAADQEAGGEGGVVRAAYLRSVLRRGLMGTDPVFDARAMPAASVLPNFLFAGGAVTGRDDMLEIAIIDGPGEFFPFLSAFEIERLE